MESLFGDVPKVKKRVRRNVQKEENLQGIKDVIKNLGYEDITVDQFVALISQHTADRGTILTKVMTEDLNSFHKMVVKVYETMTQDVSDVLANEQMELAKMYDEKHRIIINKIMRNCHELKTIYPPFNFEDFYADPEQYLRNAIVVPELPEDEEIDTVKRHLAYHRLQWLQSEGERLKAENTKLQKRLAELKNEQRKNLKQAVKNEVEAEQTHMELTQAENSMQETLEDLNQTIHELILEEDKQETQKKKMSIKKHGNGKKRTKQPKKPWQDGEVPCEVGENWNITAAQEIETTQLAEHLQSEVSRSATSAMNAKTSPQSASKFSSPQIMKKQELIDNLNASLKDVTRPTCGGTLPPGSTARMQQDRTVNRQSPQKQEFRRKNSQAPKDSWGGFY